MTFFILLFLVSLLFTEKEETIKPTQHVLQFLHARDRDLRKSYCTRTTKHSAWINRASNLLMMHTWNWEYVLYCMTIFMKASVVWINSVHPVDWEWSSISTGKHELGFLTHPRLSSVLVGGWRVLTFSFNRSPVGWNQTQKALASRELLCES